MLRFSDDKSDVPALQADGFFVGWPNPPSEQTLKRILQGSTHVTLAIEDERLVGFCTAVSDGVLSAFVPLLEVLPGYQRKGIGTQLVRRMLEQLKGLYAVDLVCDEGVVPFYRRLGLRETTAMSFRDYASQSGAVTSPKRT